MTLDLPAIRARAEAALPTDLYDAGKALGMAHMDRAALLAEVERLTRNLEAASAECADLSAYRQLVREEHPAEVAALTAEVERLTEQLRLANIDAVNESVEAENCLADSMGDVAKLMDEVERLTEQLRLATELRPDLSPAEIDAIVAEALEATRG